MPLLLVRVFKTGLAGIAFAGGFDSFIKCFMCRMGRFSEKPLNWL